MIEKAQLICPTGTLREFLSRLVEKMFPLFRTKESAYGAFIPPRHEGRIAVVTNAGRVAVDVKAPTDERRLLRTSEVVWSWRAHAGAKLATMLAHCADDGGKRWFTEESAI